VVALTVAGGAGGGSKAWGQPGLVEIVPTFKPPVLFSSGGGYPFGVAAGDVTGAGGPEPDGFPEVAIVNGDGRGNFTYDCGDNENPGLDTYDFDPPGGGGEPLPPIWNGIALGHLNGGTKPDLVATVPADLTSRAWILLGKGDGRFQYNAGDPKYRLPLDDGNGPDFSKLSIQVVCADLNQDGFDDIITTNHGSHTITVLINSTLIVGGP